MGARLHKGAVGELGRASVEGAAVGISSGLRDVRVDVDDRSVALGEVRGAQGAVGVDSGGDLARDAGLNAFELGVSDA